MALKSIRIPDDLIEFIEKQPGKDFSKKLVGIVNSYHDLSCSTERQHQIEDYNATVEEIGSLSLKMISANRKLSDINQILESYIPVYQLAFNEDFTEIIADGRVSGSCQKRD